MARSHGNPSTYNAGCRCDACRVAQNIYKRNQRETSSHDAVHQRTVRLSARWVREAHPDMWQAFRAQARAEVGR